MKYEKLNGTARKIVRDKVRKYFKDHDPNSPLARFMKKDTDLRTCIQQKSFVVEDHFLITLDLFENIDIIKLAPEN